MENAEKYAALTTSEDWQGICELNGVTLPPVGIKKELTRLTEYLESGEIVYALSSGLMSKNNTSNSSDFGFNTWLVVLTNERFLFLDCAMLSKSVDSQSVRLNRVQAVSSSQGWTFGKIMIDLGSRVITIDNCPKANVKVTSDLANKLLREAEAPEKSAQQPPEDETLLKLERLASLHQAGALTDEEFTAAKTKILSAM
jgi:hypothetical protein